MIEEHDVIATMRDGTRLAVDVYRPEGKGKYPVPSMPSVTVNWVFMSYGGQSRAPWCA